MTGMATKRTKRQPDQRRVLSEQQIVLWLRAKMGDTKHEAFAAEIGVSRQILSSVLTGRRRPGVFFLRKLRGLGVIESRQVYVVTEESCASGGPVGLPADVLS